MLFDTKISQNNTVFILCFTKLIYYIQILFKPSLKPIK